MRRNNTAPLPFHPVFPFPDFPNRGESSIGEGSHRAGVSGEARHGSKPQSLLQSLQKTSSVLISLTFRVGPSENLIRNLAGL